MNGMNMFKELRRDFSLRTLAQKLNLHVGTLRRWETKQEIPKDYLYDLNSLLGNKYNIPKQDFRSHNEFFTKKEIAKYCFDSFMNFLKIHKINPKHYVFIEPSCGDCSFYNLMPDHSRIGIDLEYKNTPILHKNFLDYYPKDSNKKYAMVGNPPFGLRGNLALRFLNHGSNFADFIAFILPPLFDSDGKGSPKKRVQNLELAHSEKLPLNSFTYPNGKEVAVATLFQIWVSKKLLETGEIDMQIKERKTCREYIKIYSLSDGGSPSSTRNKNMLDKCDIYLPSTCFHSKTNPQMKAYKLFESLPHRRGYGIVILKEKAKIKEILTKIDWEKVSFLGTNSSLNLRSSLIEDAIVEYGFYDKV